MNLEARVLFNQAKKEAEEKHRAQNAQGIKPNDKPVAPASTEKNESEPDVKASSSSAERTATSEARTLKPVAKAQTISSSKKEPFDAKGLPRSIIIEANKLFSDQLFTNPKLVMAMAALSMDCLDDFPDDVKEAVRNKRKEDNTISCLTQRIASLEKKTDNEMVLLRQVRLLTEYILNDRLGFRQENVANTGTLEFDTESIRTLHAHVASEEKRLTNKQRIQERHLKG